MANLRIMLMQTDTSNSMNNEWTDYVPGQSALPPLALGILPATPDNKPSAAAVYLERMSDPFELVLPVGGADHILGSADAPVTVVEYGDFQCPNCKQAAPAVKLLLQRCRGRLRFVYRHFPLVGVHPHAFQAALASEIAAAQGKFWPMHDLLFENQSHLELPALRRYAEHLGLDMARYDNEMADERYLERVRQHIESGERSGVRGTPGFFVNERIQDVSFGMRRLFDAVDSALRRPQE